MQEQLVCPEISAGQRLQLRAHDDLDTVALSTQARRTELTSETGQVRLNAGHERLYHREEYENSGFITTTMHDEGYDHISVIEPIMVHEDVRVIGRLMAEVKRWTLAPWVVDLCVQI